MLIKEKDFLTFEYAIKESVNIPHRVRIDKSYKMYKQGNLRYRQLYHTMERTIVGGQSSFKSMEELAEHIERSAWYLHNYNDTKYWENNNNNRTDENGKNKNNNPLSGR